MIRIAAGSRGAREGETEGVDGEDYGVAAGRLPDKSGPSLGEGR